MHRLSYISTIGKREGTLYVGHRNHSREVSWLLKDSRIIIVFDKYDVLCYSKIAILCGDMRISHFMTHFSLPVFYLKSQFLSTKINNPYEMCWGNNRRNFCLPTAPFACSANRIGESHQTMLEQRQNLFSFCISGWRTDWEVFREHGGVSKCYSIRYCILNAFQDTYIISATGGLEFKPLRSRAA